MTTEKKKQYVSPAILREVPLQLENPLLAGSVVNQQTTIETAGQQVEQRDFSTSGFNQVWE